MPENATTRDVIKQAVSKAGSTAGSEHEYVLLEEVRNTHSTEVQGDHSGCDKPPVDIKAKVLFEYMGLTLKRNFCCDVSRRFVTT